MIFALGFIMILPIPFVGNMPPGFAASVIAIGMTERDGLVVLIGTLVSAVAIAVASVATGAAIVGVDQLFRVLSLGAARCRPKPTHWRSRGRCVR